MLRVLVKESEGPVEHLVKIGTSARVLEELRVTSKPAKVKGKAGRRKRKAALEDLDDDIAEAEEQPTTPLKGCLLIMPLSDCLMMLLDCLTAPQSEVLMMLLVCLLRLPQLPQQQQHHACVTVP